jgi:phosphogluconate dehydratase
VRALYAEGKASRDDLLESEAASYHGAGTCTFYGTANSNQMLREVMGLHMPGAAFVNPGSRLRAGLTRAAVHRLAAIGQDGADYRPLGRCVDEKAMVNAMVGLLATGGSTNHAIHLPAIARAAGIVIDWEDLDDLSRVTPLLARIYPNGAGDVNAFEAAGGMAFVVRELIGAGRLHPDILTVGPEALRAYARAPGLEGDSLTWSDPPAASRDEVMLRPATAAFAPDGGMRLLTGNLGRAIIKTSAVAPHHLTTQAPARIFSSQEDVEAAFTAGELDRDVVVVVRFQGPEANGMPELHKLTPPLGVLLDRGRQVALVTDGRMSGASGKVPAAIHVTPEARHGGPISRLRDGDVVRVCAGEGSLTALVDPAEWAAREPAAAPRETGGTGRELFAFMRRGAGSAEEGASAMLAAAGL